MHDDEAVISGICCDVSNCVHNNGNCCCTAREIHVKPHNEAMEENTMCETFREV